MAPLKISLLLRPFFVKITKKTTSTKLTQGVGSTRSLPRTSDSLHLPANYNISQRTVAIKSAYIAKMKRPHEASSACQLSIAALKLKLQKKPPPEYPKEMILTCLSGLKPWRKYSPLNRSLSKDTAAQSRIFLRYETFLLQANQESLLGDKDTRGNLLAILNDLIYKLLPIPILQPNPDYNCEQAIL